MNLRLQMQGGLLAALMMAGSALAQKTPPQQPPPTPRIHHSACELGESMASRLADKGTIEPARAQQTCQMLVPTMKPEDTAEFMRCCVTRLTKGPAAPHANPPAKAAPDDRQGT